MDPVAVIVVVVPVMVVVVVVTVVVVLIETVLDVDGLTVLSKIANFQLAKVSNEKFTCKPARMNIKESYKS